MNEHHQSGKDRAETLAPGSGSCAQRQLKKLVAGAAISGLLGVLGAASTAPPASADGGNGIAAVHTGSSGYKELVYSKAATRRIANAPVWDMGTLLAGYAGLAWLPLAVDMYLYKYRAEDAVRHNQCFALVKSYWTGNIYFPGKESWGCR
jgi:hypothetical protein